MSDKNEKILKSNKEESTEKDVGNNGEKNEMKEKFEKNLKGLRDRLETNMHQAFYDLLEAEVNKETPDYKWLRNLYEEIRDKLAKILRPKSELRKEIIDTMDLELFEQMLKNKAFTPQNMQQLIFFVFEMVLKMCSPGRDELIKSKRQKLSILMESGNCTIGQMVPLFVKEANESIDTIYEDIKNLMKRLNVTTDENQDSTDKDEGGGDNGGNGNNNTDQGDKNVERVTI